MLRSLSWLLLCVFGSGCVVGRKPTSWYYSQIPANRAIKPVILLDLQKETIPLGVPLVLWETGSKRYQLTLDFLTSTAEYQQFDSIQYQIRTVENQLLTTGTLPFRNGKMNKVALEPSLPSLPESHLIRCTTPTRILLGKQRQSLRGTFLIYAVDRNGQTAIIPLDTVSLRYQKAMLRSFF